MCDPITIGIAALGAIAQTALAPKPPNPGAPPQPEKPPQASKTPDEAGVRRQNANMTGLASGGGTMLTGPLGVDPATLNLGKNTLLGA